jgi:hypothetical protein
VGNPYLVTPLELIFYHNMAPNKVKKGAIKKGPVGRGRAPEITNQSGSPALALRSDCQS